MKSRRIVGLLVALLFAGVLAVPETSAHGRVFRNHVNRSSQQVIAHVDFLHYKLALNGHPGPVDAPIVTHEDLRTGNGEVAAVRYPDFARQRINEGTEAVLASSTLMIVLRGEVSPIGTSATQRRIRTAAATASSLGTEYDLRIIGRRSVFTVRQGLLKVANSHGTVFVRPNQQTTVIPGRAPTPPRRVANITAIFAWTDTLPAPDVGEDTGLDANGGRVQGTSSRGGQWAIGHINDGLLSSGWESSKGPIGGQRVRMSFFPNRLYRIAAVIIDPAATGGDPSSMDLRRFEIRVSATNRAESSFTTVFYGTCRRKDSLQEIRFPSVPLARYVELDVLSNYGNRRRVAIAEWEVVAATVGLSTSYGIALDSSGNIYVADTGNDRIQELSPLGLPMASFGGKGSGAGQFRSPEGIAIGPAGNIYVADSDNNRVVKLSSQGKQVLTWGSFSYGSGAGQLVTPGAVASDHDGNIYVLDAGNAMVKKYSPSGHLSAEWKLFWRGNGIGATSLAVGPNGYVYVGDRGATGARIQIFSAAGKLLGATKTSGNGRDPNGSPYGLTVDHGGNVYVSDTEFGVIQKFSDFGRVLVATWKQPRNHQWTAPGAMTVDSAGNVYFVDQLLDRVVKLGPDGTVLQLWGVYGAFTQTLGSPWGIAADQHGNVYIADWVHKGLQRRLDNGQIVAFYGHPANLFLTNPSRAGAFFDPAGVAIDRHGVVYVADPYGIQKLTNFGPIGVIQPKVRGNVDLTELALDAHGNIYATSPEYHSFVKMSRTGRILGAVGGAGTGPGKFNRPNGIAIGLYGWIYVSDYGNDRVEVFSSKGTYLRSWKSPFPEGIATTPNGNVYVAEARPYCRVREFTATGTYRRTFGAGCGTARNQFSLPEDLTIDNHGDLYVTDMGNDRVAKYSPTGSVLSIWE